MRVSLARDRHHAVLIDSGDGFVVGAKPGQLGDVFGGAVLPMDDHLEFLCLAVFRKVECAWPDLEPVEIGGRLGVVLRSILNPVEDEVVFPAILLEAQFASVLFLHRGLEQEQAVLRSILVGARTFFLRDQFLVILVEIVAEQ